MCLPLRCLLFTQTMCGLDSELVDFFFLPKWYIGLNLTLAHNIFICSIFNELIEKPSFCKQILILINIKGSFYEQDMVQYDIISCYLRNDW